MGCSPGKAKVVRPSTIAAAAHTNEEIEEVANLPIRAKAEDMDLVSMVELNVRCTDLTTSDGAATDTLVVFYLQTADGWLEKGRTEVIRATSSPKFIASFAVQYCFEKKQRFRMDVYDYSSMPDVLLLVRHTIIGSAVFNIHEVVCSPTQSITRSLSKPNERRDKGSITVTSEEMSRLNHTLKLTFRMITAYRNVPIFFRLSRSLEENIYIPFYESEQITGPEWNWKSFETTVNAFCRGNEARLVQFELFRAKKKEPQLLGSFTLTLADLKFTGTRFEGTVKNGERTVARVGVLEFVYAEKASFLDYIFGGCEISLVIGVDFTRSNGTPDSKDSLHYLEGAESENEYITAIRAVGDILQYYDSDKRVPVFGFGAKLPPYFDIVSHCFALNGDIFDPEVKGIDKVVEAYRRSCKEVVFHGPTALSHLLRRVAAIAGAREVNQDQQQYFLLLIITDGNVNDMEATSHELVVASALPLSVIIVGVGDEDFSKMRELDADENPLYSKRLDKFMERDIVQFVPFSNFKSNTEELARQVLFEVPEQLLSYMEKKNIKPGMPKNTVQTLESLQRQGTVSVQPMLSSNRHITIPSPINMVNTPALLQQAKRKFIEDAVALGFDFDAVEEILHKGIPCADVNILVELMNYNKQQRQQERLKLSEQNLSEILSINEDNQNVDSLLCKICFSRPVDIVLLECGHRVVCGVCVKDLGGECPACHNIIVKWIKSR